MKRINYIVLICLLVVGLLAVWCLRKMPIQEEDNVTLMPPFQANDTLENEKGRIRTVLRSIPRHNEQGHQTEEYKIVFEMDARYMLLLSLSEERRQEYLTSEESTLRRLSEEEMDYLNQLIKIRKITMPDEQP